MIAAAKVGFRGPHLVKTASREHAKYLTTRRICLNNRQMGLYSIFPRIFSPPSRPRLAAAPLLPQRLERRRVLDASAASLLLGPSGASEFVQVGEIFDPAPTEADSLDTVAAANLNTPPSAIKFLNVSKEVTESGIAQLAFQFEDPDIGDTHTVEIDWGDGTIDTLTLKNDEREVSATHRYLDDTPTGPTEVPYAVAVKVTDSDGGIATAKTQVLVKNSEPLMFVSPVSDIAEGGVARLSFIFFDPGILDTHVVEIDWGDGTVDTVIPPAGDRSLIANHQYLDDTPTGPTEVAYTINVKLSDDDGGVATAKTSVLVKNVAPSNLQVTPVAVIDENSFTQLQITFDDPGTLDTHAVEIDWGDGTIDTLTPPSGSRFLIVNHQYLDDMPTGPTEIAYPIDVKVTDDDGGVATAKTSVLVKNVAPTIDRLFLSQSVIEEGNSVTVTGTYSDASRLDTHTVMVRWGDGTSEVPTFTNVNGAGSFTATHFYADNDTPNPDDGPVPDNLYTVAVTVVDDDGGETTKTIDLTVLNVSPILDPIIEATDVNSRGETFLTIRFSDPGADTLTVYVDWGDVRDPSDPSMRALQPFVIDLTGIDGPGTFTVTLMHVYSGPPNPASPAADIDLFVFVADDDFGDAVVADGQSEIRMATIKNPGIGEEPVFIDTTPQVPRLVFPPRAQSFFFETTSTDAGGRSGGELQAAAGDTNVTTERYLELREFDEDGNLVESYRLKPEVLRDLPGLFRKLPDKHYEIHLVHTETNTRRLVLAFDIRKGKAIDLSDDSEGTLDRPPTDEVIRPFEEAVETSDETTALPPANFDPLTIDQPSDRPTATQFTGLAMVGLAASQSFSSWAEQVDRTVAQAGRKKWQRLRLHRPNRRKNR